MPFDESLLEPISTSNFDPSLLEPVRTETPTPRFDASLMEPVGSSEELTARNLAATERIRQFAPNYDVDRGAKTLFQTLTTPIASMVSPQQLADAIDTVKSIVGADPESPEYSEIVKEALAEPSRKPSTAEEITAGVQNVAANVTTTPLALALPGAPAGVQRLLAYGFTAQQIAHLPESIKEAKEAKTPYERTKAYLGLGLDIGFPLLFAAHEGLALRNSLTTEAPKPPVETQAAQVGPATEAAVKETVQETKGIEGEPVLEIKTPQEAVPTTEPTPPPETPAEPAREVAAPVAETGIGSVGPGAASPEEFQPKELITSIKNARVDEERVARGLPALYSNLKRSFGNVWDQAMRSIEENVSAPEELVKELIYKPRAVTDVEDAMLLHRRVDLQNSLDKTSSALIEARELGNIEHAESLQIEASRLSDALIDLEEASRAAGTETARGLAARRMLANEQFTLAKMLVDKRVANEGRRLTPEQETEVKAQHEKIEETQKAITEREAATETGTSETAAETALAELRQKTGEETEQRDLPAERDEIIAGLKLANAENPPLPELRSFIQKLAENFVRSGITERDALVDVVHDVLKGIIKDISRRQTMDAISGYGEFKPLNPDEIKAKLRDLKGQMQQVSKLEDLLARKPLEKTGVERRAPSDEERRLQKLVNEYKKRYGVQVSDPAAQLKSALDSIKTRLKNQIADLGYQISTGKKIVRNKTASPSDAEVEALRKERDELKAEFDKIFPKEGLTDQQRVERAIAAVEKSISTLEEKIKNKDIAPMRGKPKTPSTPELEAARARRDALREELQELRNLAKPKKTPEEIALQSAKTRIKNTIADYMERLAKGDFAPKVRRTVTPDTELNRLRAENERWKQAYRTGLARDRLQNRSTLEKMQDTFVKWRRGFLLSSPVTLAKLTSAAVQRMTASPLEELVGTGLSKLIPSVSERAPREGGGVNAKAEAKAITEAFTQGMRDAWKTLRTGKSDLDVLYGRPDLMPREAIDFFGNLHGALKAQTKRNEFARSFEKRVASAIDQGIDVSDPLVQTRIAVEAYKDAQRSIFLQDNRVVAAYRAGIARLEQPSKTTGKPTPSGKAIATAAKTLLPIVRVPTNIVAETIQYATGSVTGSVRLANALRKGVDNLTPEQADLIMRDLKKGTIGATIMLLGFLNPDIFGGYYQPGEKRKASDVKAGRARIYGAEIPSYLLHNPLLETLQIGATVRRVADSKLRKKDLESQGITTGLMAAAMGLADEVPFVREMINVEKLMNPHERGQYLGELAKSILVPQVLQWTAQQMDKNSVTGEPTQRKPETLLQHVESGIPVLRKEVPTKKEKLASNR